jgi:hypothetical protein
MTDRVTKPRVGVQTLGFETKTPSGYGLVSDDLLQTPSRFGAGIAEQAQAVAQ